MQCNVSELVSILILLLTYKTDWAGIFKIIFFYNIDLLYFFQQIEYLDLLYLRLLTQLVSNLVLKNHFKNRNILSLCILEQKLDKKINPPPATDEDNLSPPH